MSLTPALPNRWIIAIAGVVMQIALGAVYAWSVFRIPLTKAYGWTVPQVTIVFEVAIFMLGLAAFVGGLWMKRKGPRVVALTAGVLYGAGVILAGQAQGNLLWLYLSFGLLGGVGVGLGYIVPVATLIAWFPDKRGLITGVAVAGFGAGALITAPVAQHLLVSVGISQTFTVLGIAYFVAVVGAAFFIQSPPEGYRPAGWTPSASAQARAAQAEYTLGQALRSPQWYALWAILFLNTVAGIAIISQGAPIAQEVSGVTAAVAAGLVGTIAIANGSGRFLWSWLSDFIGRKGVFLTMFLVQAVAFFALSRVHVFGAVGALAFIILLCYGGGFGTMPAFAADYFGSRNVGSIYGLMLTAWGTAGVVGPAVIASIRQTTGHYTLALELIAGLTLVSTLLPALIRPPAPRAGS